MKVLASFYLTVENLEQIVALAKAVGMDISGKVFCEMGDVNIRIFGGGQEGTSPAIEFSVLEERSYKESQ